MFLFCVQISLLKQSLELQLSQSQSALQQLQSQFNQERELLSQQLKGLSEIRLLVSRLFIYLCKLSETLNALKLSSHISAGVIFAEKQKEIWKIKHPSKFKMLNNVLQMFSFLLITYYEQQVQHLVWVLCDQRSGKKIKIFKKCWKYYLKSVVYKLQIQISHK